MRITSRAKIAARHALRRAGFDLVRSLPPDDLLRRRIALLRRHGINVLFDVGANAGQYAATMRALGYEGRIVSFEPSSEAFPILADAARRDPTWTVVRSALGQAEQTVTLYVSANSQSSSLLPMLPSHEAADPASRYIADETVEMSTLATQIDRHLEPDDRLFVKIDTQGTELQVLAGARSEAMRIFGLQVELSLVPLYEGQPLMEEVVRSVRAMGYAPVSIEPDFFDPRTAHLLQADGIFFRPAPDETGTRAHHS